MNAVSNIFKVGKLHGNIDAFNHFKNHNINQELTHIY